MGSFDALRRIAWECNRDLPRHGLVTLTFGNASAFDPDSGVFAIKPSGVPFENLTPDSMVVVDLEGNTVEGRLRPSSDTKTHAVLYRHWPEIGGIVHTHSRYAVAWAQALRDIPVFGTTHADCVPEDIPCTEIMSDQMIQGNYEEETGRQILRCFASRSHRDMEMVLVACHGPFTWGGTPYKAVENSVLLEEIAATALHTLTVNPDAPRLKQTLLEKHFLRKHGPDAYYGQS